MAFAHESGAGRLPERPAFQLALEDMKAAVRAEVRRQLTASKRRAGNYTLNTAKIGEIATKALQASYLSRAKQLQPVSARRAKAKAGIAGRGQAVDRRSRPAPSRQNPPSEDITVSDAFGRDQDDDRVKAEASLIEMMGKTDLTESDERRLAVIAELGRLRGWGREHDVFEHDDSA